MIKKVDKVWGREEWLVNNEKYCAKYLYLNKGYQCSLHYHKNKDETFEVLVGTLELEVSTPKVKLSADTKDAITEYTIHTIRLHPGEQVRLRPYTIHRFRSLTDVSVFLEVSTYHDDNDSYRIEKSRKI
jgi:D-lyxose ketol-isomerase